MYDAEIIINRDLESKVKIFYENKINQDELKNKLIETATKRSESLDIVRTEAEIFIDIGIQLEKKKQI